MCSIDSERKFKLACILLSVCAIYVGGCTDTCPNVPDNRARSLTFISTSPPGTSTVLARIHCNKAKIALIKRVKVISLNTYKTLIS